MASADALLLPSTFEPFGLVMLEAMASGCMVLSSDCDGPRGVVRPPWGILMPFRNPRERVAELEAGINKLLSLTRAELEERGVAAREAGRRIQLARLRPNPCRSPSERAGIEITRGPGPPAVLNSVLLVEY